MSLYQFVRTKKQKNQIAKEWTTTFFWATTKYYGAKFSMKIGMAGLGNWK